MNPDQNDSTFTVPLRKKLIEGLERLNGMDCFTLDVITKILALRYDKESWEVAVGLLKPLLARAILHAEVFLETVENSQFRASTIVEYLGRTFEAYHLAPLLLTAVKPIIELIAETGQILPSLRAASLRASQEAPSTPQVPNWISASIQLPRFCMKLRQEHRLDWLRFIRQVDQSATYLPNPIAQFPSGHSSWEVLIVKISHPFQSSDGWTDTQRLDTVKEVLKARGPRITWNCRKLSDKNDLIWVTEAERYGKSPKSRTLLTSKSSQTIWIALFHSKQTTHSSRKRARASGSRNVSNTRFSCEIPATGGSTDPLIDSNCLLWHESNLSLALPAGESISQLPELFSLPFGETSFVTWEIGDVTFESRD